MSTDVTRRDHDYAVTVDGQQVGLAAYVELDDRVVFTHTEVDEAMQGRGLASALAQAALDDVRRRGKLVVPQCSFIKGWIARHPDYEALVAA